LTVNRRFGVTYPLHLQCRRKSQGRNQRKASGKQRLFLAWLTPSTVKMDPTCSSERSVDFQRTARCHLPDDSTPRDHRCENLKPILQRLNFHIVFTHVQYMDSSVSIVSTVWAQRLRNLDSIPGRSKRFLSSAQRPDRRSGPRSLLFNGQRGLFPCE
jgi:hypothetical protein